MDDPIKIIELATSLVKLACEVAATIPVVRGRVRERKRSRRRKR